MVHMVGEQLLTMLHICFKPITAIPINKKIYGNSGEKTVDYKITESGLEVQLTSCWTRTLNH